ncbi:MAG TPA: flagellar filament capping protein FliD [Bryobacteraceae bacterium]|nr:flagellar filament capping protein FliD [Bryobacteraceae bacterium]
MGSSSSSITSPVTFNGSSTFSTSFQQVLQRAVDIASLPMQAMQNNVNTYQSQESQLSSLQATFGSLQNSLEDIAADAQGSPTATSSNNAVVTASAASSALTGTYTIEVDDPGASTTALSPAPSTTSNPSPTTLVTDPTTESIDASTTYTLWVNGQSYDLTPSGNTLEALASAINTSGAGVQATIVNMGSNASPDYRLAVTSTSLNADTISLYDGTDTPDTGTNNLLGTLSTGHQAQYKVGGNSTTLYSTSSQITLAPGLTANIVSSAPGQSVSISVAADYSSLSNDLSNFATAYNSAVDALTQNRGQAGGALTGESIVLSLQEALSQVALYSNGSGTVQSLSDLGLNLDSTGHISFDAGTFASANPAAVQQFLGDITSGGFLQAANDTLTGVADPTSGAIASDISSLQDEITNTNNEISDQQDQINTLQTNLSAQLTAADAAIAVLEQQKIFFADMFAVQYGTNSTTGAGGTI